MCYYANWENQKVISYQELEAEYQNEQSYGLNVLRKLLYQYPLNVSFFFVKMFSKNQLYGSKYKAVYNEANKCLKLSIFNKINSLPNEFTISEYTKSSNTHEPSLLIVSKLHENLRSIEQSSFKSDCDNTYEFILVKCLNDAKDLKSLVLDGLQNKIAIVEIQLYDKDCDNLKETVTLIQQCTNLEQIFFQISGKDDGDKISEIVERALFKSLRIVQIEISFCNLRTLGIRYLCGGLSRCKMVERLSLNLRTNALTDESIIILGNQISQLVGLKHLELCLFKNQIKQGISDFANLLSNCSNLEFLGLQLILGQLVRGHFSISEIQIIKDFGQAIAKCKYLHHFKIECDFILVDCLYIQLSKSQSLKVVEIATNQFEIHNKGVRIDIKRNMLKTKRLTLLQFF